MNGNRGGLAPDQTLDQDAESRMAKLKSNDEEMDQGLDAISNSIDTLTRIAGDMNQEVIKTQFLYCFVLMYSFFLLHSISHCIVLLFDMLALSIIIRIILIIIYLSYLFSLFLLLFQTRHQNAKIENIDMRMQRGAEKQAIVNARLRSLVKNA